MSKAIVFGGSGFLGSHIADSLSDKGLKVTIFDKQPSLYLRGDQKFIQGNILDTQHVERSIKGQHYVYHLAGQANIEESFYNPRQTLEINIIGTNNILEGCKNNKLLKRFVFASSLYIYSDVGGFYRTSKQCSELIIEEYQKNFDINFTIIRYGSIYGSRSDDRNFIHRVLKEAILEKCIKVSSDKDEKRDYIHVKDAALNSTTILSEEFNNSYVLATGNQQMSRGEIIDLICEILGGDIPVDWIQRERNKSCRHYKLTPYSFKPKIAKKIIRQEYIDIGQGIFDCMNEIYDCYL